MNLRARLRNSYCRVRPTRWGDSESRTLCFQLDGGEEKSPVGDYMLFLILNAHYQAQAVRLPPVRDGWWHWARVMDTSLPAGSDFLEAGQEVRLDPADVYLTNARSTVVLVGK